MPAPDRPPAVVTGASTGTGRALAAEGQDLVLAADEAAIDEVGREAVAARPHALVGSAHERMVEDEH